MGLIKCYVHWERNILIQNIIQMKSMNIHVQHLIICYYLYNAFLYFSIAFLAVTEASNIGAG